MSSVINEEVKRLFNDKSTKKVLATVDKKGEVHVVFKGSPFVNEEGNIELLELIETSATNRNLTYAIWFKKQVAFNILSEDGKSFEVRGSKSSAACCGTGNCFWSAWHLGHWSHFSVGVSSPPIWMTSEGKMSMISVSTSSTN